MPTTLPTIAPSVSPTVEPSLAPTATPAPRVIFVNAGGPVLSPGDILKQTRFNAWGYDVTFLKADSSAAVFNATIDAAFPNTVVFVTENVMSSEVNSKLVGQSIGIVLEEALQAVDFKMTNQNPSGGALSRNINIVNNTHYITQDIPSTGLVNVFFTGQGVTHFSGTLASPGVQTLAKDPNFGNPTLLAVEEGALMLDGKPARGRRVVLPFGISDTDFNNIMPLGIKLYERSLEWCMGFSLVRRQLIATMEIEERSRPPSGPHWELQATKSSSLSSLTNAILSSKFSGASGPVEFGRDYKKGRNQDGIAVGVYNIRPGPISENGKRSHGAFMISIFQEGLGWVQLPGATLIYRDGTSVFMGVYRQFQEANYITPLVRAMGLALMLLAWFIAVVALVLIGWFRKDPIVQRAQPFLMAILCVGSIITSATIASVSFDEDAGWTSHQLSIACSLSPWFFFSGHILIFCSFFIKLWRAERVLISKEDAVKVYAALWPLVLFLATAFSILTAHSIYDPWSWERELILESPAETYGKCQSKYDSAFFAPLVGLVLVAEAITLYFAWRTLHIDSDYRDSGSILYSCFVQIEAWSVGVPMLVLIGFSSADATYFARLSLVWVFAVSGVVLVVYPKIYKAIQLRRNPHLRQGLNRRRMAISSLFDNRSSGINSTQELHAPTPRPTSSLQQFQMGLSHSDFESSSEETRSIKDASGGAGSHTFDSQTTDSSKSNR